MKEGSRVVTFALAEGDYISLRHHVYVKTGYNSVELAEVGPRMEMKLFELRLGTVDNKDADYEWRLANYTRYVPPPPRCYAVLLMAVVRTARKRDLL